MFYGVYVIFGFGTEVKEKVENTEVGHERMTVGKHLIVGGVMAGRVGDFRRECIAEVAMHIAWSCEVLRLFQDTWDFEFLQYPFEYMMVECY